MAANGIFASKLSASRDDGNVAAMGGKWTREKFRIIRDPIHGDIVIPRISGAVIDTLEFQRLRYIRQMGLLHFVFPGAVHTRFTHSIGTMHLARRAARSVFRHSGNSASTRYLSTTLELAALLHDVGHCAFSHSIEHVELNGRPFFGTNQRCLKRWGAGELHDAWMRVDEQKRPDKRRSKRAADHETIGLILIDRIFEAKTVIAACEQEGLDAAELAADVQAVIHGGLPVSQSFEKHSKKAVSFSGGSPTNKSAGQLRVVLHSLVSGTLDVDRLDYLNRDSIHCGVPYGRCDVDIILASLHLYCHGDMIALGIEERAVQPMDDFLWSRFQLFLQILNHKTNVALNRMLEEAIPELVAEGFVKPPASVKAYLSFTDDVVMSTVLKQCFHTGKYRKTVWGKTLAERKVPRHLGAREYDRETEHDGLIDEIRGQANLGRQKKIYVAKGKSQLIKEGDELPIVLPRHFPATDELARNYKDLSRLFRKPEAGVRAVPAIKSQTCVLHVFTQR